MKLDPKWLLPPAAALCLLLGPLAMSSRNAAADPAAAQPTAPAGKAPPASAGAPTLPRTPDAWQVASTLAGVVLLGVAGVWLARRWQRGPAATGNGAAALRQTLRLSGKQALHVLEFDDRVLLVGASDAGLQLLAEARSGQPAADEAAIAARADEDGAVPRDLVIPRPADGPSRRLPTPPRTPALGDFRSLLQKAGKA